jgi:hypothetical protein
MIVGFADQHGNESPPHSQYTWSSGMILIRMCMALSLILVGRSEKRLAAQNNRESVVLHEEIECFITSGKGEKYLQVIG